MRGCPGKLYTNLDATEQLLNELKRLAAEYLRPVSEIYDELASNASTSLDTAAYFPSWDQARNTKYYSRAKRYPRLLARRQDLRLTAEQTTTKSGWCEAAGAEMGHLRLSHPALHSKAEELGVHLAPAKFVCDFETALIPSIQGNFPNTRVQGCFFHFCQAVFRQVDWLGLRTDYINNQEVGKKVEMLMLVSLGPAGFEILNVGMSGELEALLEYFQREWFPATKIPLWNVHGVLGKTVTVLRQMDEGYTRGRNSVRRSATCGVQPRQVAALTGRLRRSEISIEHFLSKISYHTPAPLQL
ncbi:hypothetical protein T4A_11359 [Trichinella pseudospiralis]|uniref:MULE transposase domain-containing protein n=1 Tax=Trichinella pseudospiralis TaxID=6337 RepID=A0A0V1EXV3_TRIPS|nr:hypothetical protein T4A_11359 [Trichinella pseudospiralis]